MCFYCLKNPTNIIYFQPRNLVASPCRTARLPLQNQRGDESVLLEGKQFLLFSAVADANPIIEASGFRIKLIFISKSQLKKSRFVVNGDLDQLCLLLQCTSNFSVLLLRISVSTGLRREVGLSVRLTGCSNSQLQGIQHGGSRFLP